MKDPFFAWLGGIWIGLALNAGHPVLVGLYAVIGVALTTGHLWSRGMFHR